MEEPYGRNFLSDGILPIILRPAVGVHSFLLGCGKLVGERTAIEVQPLDVEQGRDLPDLPLELVEAAARPAAPVKDLGHEEAGGEVPAVPREIMTQS